MIQGTKMHPKLLRAITYLLSAAVLTLLRVRPATGIHHPLQRLRWT